MYLKSALSILVFLVSYTGFLAFDIPAGWVVSRVDSRLQAAGVAVTAARGSAWHGSGEVALHGTPVGTLAWRTSPWPLVAGRLEAGLRLRGSAIEVSARVRDTRKGLRVTQLDGRAALSFLARLAGLPTALDGTLVARIREAVLGNGGTLESASGRLEAHAARLPRLGVSLGTLTLRVTPAGDGIHGRFRNTGGDLAVAGELTLKPGGAYAVRATLKPRRGQNRLRDALAAVLGAPDVEGRYHYHATGRLHP